MPRFYLPSSNHHGVPLIENPPGYEPGTYVQKPPMFCQVDAIGNPIKQYVKASAGSVALGLSGYGFFIVAPGGFVDLDVSVPLDAVKAACPQLLTELEAKAAGLLDEKKSKAKE